MRTRIRLAALVLGSTFPALRAVAQAQAAAPWPTKPLTLVVPTVAGGAVDALARTFAEQLGPMLGQTVIVDNKPGASGIVGTQAVAQAPADGHTLLFAHAVPLQYAPLLSAKPLPYDVRRDFAFVTQVARSVLVLAVNGGVPAKNVKELLAWAATRRGQLSYGSYGIGSPAHLVLSYFSETQRLDMNHVPYKGEVPMLQDLLAGHTVMAIGSAGSMQPHFESGRLRAIAVLGDRRLPDLPAVATMAEQGHTGPEFGALGGVWLLAPAGTPAPVLTRLESASRAIIAGTPMRARLHVYGLPVAGGSADEARRVFGASLPLIERLVRVSGARTD